MTLRRLSPQRSGFCQEKKERTDERQRREKRMEYDDESKKVLPGMESNKRQRTDSDAHSKKIFVRMTKTIAVDVTNTNTIDAIKAKVQLIEGIESSKQKLVFGGTRLKGTKTVEEYYIPANSCIDLYVKDGITISIQPLKNPIFSLNVKTSDTVSKIKAMIHGKEGIPSDQQTLLFSHKMLNDDQTLASCGIHNNAVLRMIQFSV